MANIVRVARKVVKPGASSAPFNIGFLNDENTDQAGDPAYCLKQTGHFAENEDTQDRCNNGLTEENHRGNCHR